MGCLLEKKDQDAVSESNSLSLDCSPEVIHHVAKGKVGSRARKGAVWSMMQIVGRNLLSIGTTAVLARLLTPDDYGLIGMVATLTALLLVFSDMGLSWSTIQKRELNAIQVSNLFWINAVAGVALWLVCIALAPHIAAFYGRPELLPVTMVLGSSFFFGGIAVQPFALLRRRMDFRRVAIVEIAAVFAAAIAALVSGLCGLGYWALVVQAIVGQIVRLAIVFPSSHLKLQRPQSGVGTREMVSFGGLLALNGLLIYSARNLDSVLIGRYWGTAELGYYNRAYFLMLLPSMLATGVLTDLMVPSLSAFQDEPKRFGNAYRRAVRMVAFFGSPMAAGLALTAPEIVRLMYGPKWLAVIPMLVWLSIAGITQPVYNTTGWLFTAAGKAKLYFAVTAFNAIVLAVAFLWAARLGATEVAMAYGLVMGLVLLWPAMWFAHKAAELKLCETARWLWPVALSVLIMSVVVFAAGRLSIWLGLTWLAVFIVKVIVGVAVYTLAGLCLLAPMLREDLLPMLPRRIAVFVEGKLK